MLSTEREYKIYRHTNIHNGKVYIGITKQDVEKRWQNGHGYEGTYFGRAINKYGWNGFKHEILISGLTTDEACGAEKLLIKLHKSDSREFGYNICEGGQTGDNLQPHYGAENCRAVSVRRINPETKEVVLFNTTKDAVNEMDINHRGISKACRGLCKTYMGYVWEYDSIDFEKPKKLPRGKHLHKYREVKIKMIEPNGEIREFESMLEASRELGIRANNIARYVSGERHDASGRRWFRDALDEKAD